MAGVVGTAAVLSQVPLDWWDVPVPTVLAAFIPAVSAESYGFRTAAATRVILPIAGYLPWRPGPLEPAQAGVAL